MVQPVHTVADVDPACKYHLEPPFLIVSHAVEDIGLVGWQNKRWTHQDKARREQPAPRAHASTGWMQAYDPDRSMYYFYKTSLSITTWEEPDEQFEADETVKYYVRLGIAPPWNQSNELSESKKKSGVTLRSHEHVVSSAQSSTLVPASVRFSPAKKGELQPNVERYWITRYSLFSRWSSGVCLDETSLFSVTPEVIAKHHARMLKGGGSVLDAFCGCGGNTIALAQQFDTVVACDIDQGQLAMAQRNCEAYGVSDKVSWVRGDVFKGSFDKVGAVFLSPPWGGPGGIKNNNFDATHALPGVSWSVKDSIEMACSHLSQAALRLDGENADVPNIAVYLPRATLISSLRDCLEVPGFQLKPLCLERNVLNGQLKTATLYLRCSAVSGPD